MAKVRVNGAPAGPSPKAVPYAQIDKQGRIPYGKTAEAKIPMSLKRGTSRGMGAATKGGGYWEC
tara:strand:- start:560 stop:751 length:192 start_codon:yes stop_codon:yes gene_type:complete